MRRKSVKQIINEGNAIISVLQNEVKSLKSNVETRKMLFNQTVFGFDITRKKHLEKIKVLENFRDVARAHLAGKTIQFNLYGEWSDITYPLKPDMEPERYRVKPDMIPVVQPNQGSIDRLFGVAKSLDEKRAEVKSLPEINHGTEANKPSGILTFCDPLPAISLAKSLSQNLIQLQSTINKSRMSADDLAKKDFGVSGGTVFKPRHVLGHDVDDDFIKKTQDLNTVLREAALAKMKSDMDKEMEKFSEKAISDIKTFHESGKFGFFMGKETHSNDSEDSTKKRDFREMLDNAHLNPKFVSLDHDGQIHVKKEKPPLGLLPKGTHKEMRLSDIKEAMRRYIDARKPIPQEWTDEYNELVSKAPF